MWGFRVLLVKRKTLMWVVRKKGERGFYGGHGLYLSIIMPQEREQRRERKKTTIRPTCLNTKTLNILLIKSISL